MIATYWILSSLFCYPFFPLSPLIVLDFLYFFLSFFVLIVLLFLFPNPRDVREEEKIRQWTDHVDIPWLVIFPRVHLDVNVWLIDTRH